MDEASGLQITSTKHPVYIRRNLMIKLKSELLPQARLLLMVTFALLAVHLVAFGQADSGRIAGTLADQNGALVPGASVVAKNERTGEERTVASSDAGTY